ncbi:MULTISPECIES: DsbA family protein [Xanthobacter]|uniref:DsbA family protein n=1 Tax=Xanthobacter TaxID=279 RepID=UPI001F3BE64C|nr:MULTISPECIES: DsbA family protein [unclassified Xanthobacter]
MTFDRRRVLAGAGAAALLAGLGLPLSTHGALAQSVDMAKVMAPAASPLPPEVLGSPDAPVTVVEYASMTCSHCADFHTKVFPELKAKYIDTGKVRFIFREFPFDPVATAAFMLARCAPKDKYFPMVSTLFETQRSWAYSKDPAAGLLAVVRQTGMSQADFEKCLSDKDLAQKVQESSKYANTELGVNATPTFFVGGKKLSGSLDIAEWDKELEPLLSKK